MLTIDVTSIEARVIFRRMGSSGPYTQQEYAAVRYFSVHSITPRRQHVAYPRFGPIQGRHRVIRDSSAVPVVKQVVPGISSQRRKNLPTHMTGAFSFHRRCIAPVGSIDLNAPPHRMSASVKSGQRGVGQNPSLSASLIGRLGSSTFRLSTTAVLMSLTGSRFSSESALRPFHHGIRGRGGTICYAALPSD